VVGANYLHAGFTTYDSSGTPWLHPSVTSRPVRPEQRPADMTWDNTNSLIVGNSRYLIERIGLTRSSSRPA